MDNDTFLDIIYCHTTDTTRTYTFDGFQIDRIATDIRIRSDIVWGAYKRFARRPIIHRQVILEKQARDAELAAADSGAVEGHAGSGQRAIGHGKLDRREVEVGDFVRPEDGVRHGEGPPVDHEPDHTIGFVQSCRSSPRVASPTTG